MKVKREAFKQLMEETGVHGKSSYSEFHSKHGKDERFKGIEKNRYVKRMASCNIGRIVLYRVTVQLDDYILRTFELRIAQTKVVGREQAWGGTG